MGKLVSSVIGIGASKAKDAQPAKGGKFQPFTYTGLAGTASGTPSGESFNFSQELNPTLESLYNQGLNNSGGFLQGFLNQSNTAVPGFDYQSGDIRQRESEIFDQQANLLRPGFTQQNNALREDMFGTGRLGLNLSSGGAGAGAGNGMVNPDMYGLGLAQSRALAELGPASRQLANEEQAQDFGQQAAGYNLNQQAQETQLRNLLGGFTGAFGAAQGVQDMESGLIGQGAGLEQARSGAVNSAYAAGTPAQARKPGLLETMAVAYAKSAGGN